MKNLTKLWSLALLLTAAMFMVSCGEDEPVIEVDEDGVAVSNGYYFTLNDEDPVAEKALLPEKVEGEGFAATDRAGFYGNYVFLNAGDYQLKKVEAREVVATIGGTLAEPEDEGQEGYLVAEATEGGGPISLAEAGYYKVSYDEELAELIMMKVTSVSLIGSATPNGWGGDTQLEVAQEASDEGFVFSGSDIIMRGGEFKIRINNRWTIDRRIDRTASTFDPNNGYVAFTNYGGSPDALVAGGSNMTFDGANEGTFEVTITLTNEGGAAFESSRTGDAPEITFDPAEYSWAFVGNATADNWGEFNDRNLFYKGVENGVHTWVGVTTFGADGEFKFRANDAWNIDLGGSLPADGSQVALSVGGNNIPSPGAGDYYVKITTADEGETWNASMTEAGWGVIGVGSPQGNWDADMDMTADGFAGGVTTYTITGDFTAEEWKFRAGDEWVVDLGGALDALTLGGNNITLSEAGNYTVVLSFDGNDYTATATKN